MLEQMIYPIHSHADRIVDDIIGLAESVVQSKPKVNISISSLIIKRDINVNSIILHINDRLKAICLRKGWSFIDNSYIKIEHLKHNSIHLNKVGVKLLASNIIRQAFRPSDR